MYAPTTKLLNKKHSQAHLLLVAVQMHVSVQKNVTAPAVMSSHLLQKLHYKMYGLLNSMAMLWKELFWNDLSSITTLHNNIWFILVNFSKKYMDVPLNKIWNSQLPQIKIVIISLFWPLYKTD